MKKTLAVGVFATLFFTALQANAIGGNGIMTIDKPLSPPKGKEGIEVTIYGHDFGTQNSGSYVKFADYIDTEIASWTDDKIQFIVPTKIEVLNAPKNFIMRLPIIGGVAKLMTQIAPIKFAGEATGGEDIVSVSITNRIDRYIIESNKVDFQYTPSDPTPSSQKQAMVNIRNLVVDPLRATGLFFKDYLFCFCSNETKQKYLENSMNDIVRWSAEYVAKPATQVLGLKLSQNVAETAPATPQTPTQNTKITPEPKPITTPTPPKKTIPTSKIIKNWQLVSGDPADTCTAPTYTGEVQVRGWYEFKEAYGSQKLWVLRIADEDTRILPFYDSSQKIDDNVNSTVLLKNTSPELEQKLKNASRNNPQIVDLKGYELYCEGGPVVSQEPFQVSQQQAPKNNPPETQPQPSPGTPSTNKQEKFLTIQFVDQYGFPVFISDDVCYGLCNAVVLYDGLGDRVPGRFSFQDNIALFDKEVPAGKYTVETRAGDVSGHNYDYKINTVDRTYAASKNIISVPQNGNWAVKLQINQEKITYFQNLYITFTVTNELGTPIGSGAYDEWSGRYLMNDNGEKVSMQLLGGLNGIYKVDSIGHGFAPGGYTLHIEHNGYNPAEKSFNLPDVSRIPDEQIRLQKPGVIDLGTIVLKKQ